jgi:hypothetical protein
VAEEACGLECHHALKYSEHDNIHILIIQIELFIYDFFSFRFLTTEAMLPLLPCTARRCRNHKTEVKVPPFPERNAISDFKSDHDST